MRTMIEQCWSRVHVTFPTSSCGLLGQGLDWHNDPEIMKSIINFYTKVWGPTDQLGSFYCTECLGLSLWVPSAL